MTALRETYFTPSPEELFNAQGEIVAIRHDVSSLLAEVIGEDWQKRMADVVISSAVSKVVDANDPTCREEDSNQMFELHITRGETVVEAFPIIEKLYQGEFLAAMLGATNTLEGVHPYHSFADASHFITQFPAGQRTLDEPLQRMDAHVDVRPTGILVVQAPAHSGELVIGQPSAKTKDEIDEDCTVVGHVSGTFIAFPRGRELPHYTRPVALDDYVRVVASIDYLGDGQSPDDARALEVNERISIKS